MRCRRRVDFQGYLQNELLISRERAEFGGIVVINTQGVIRHQIDVQKPMDVVSDRLVEGLELNGCRTRAGWHVENRGEDIDTVPLELRELALEGGRRNGIHMVGPSNYYIIPMARSYVYILVAQRIDRCRSHFLGSNGRDASPESVKVGLKNGL